MTLPLFSGLRHVIDNVMETHYITLWVGISNVMTTYVTTVQIFIEINKLWPQINHIQKVI